jgi:hypothetical protein
MLQRRSLAGNGFRGPPSILLVCFRESLLNGHPAPSGPIDNIGQYCCAELSPARELQSQILLERDSWHG